MPFTRVSSRINTGFASTLNPIQSNKGGVRPNSAIGANKHGHIPNPHFYAGSTSKKRFYASAISSTATLNSNRDEATKHDLYEMVDYGSFFN